MFRRLLTVVLIVACVVAAVELVPRLIFVGPSSYYSSENSDRLKRIPYQLIYSRDSDSAVFILKGGKELPIRKRRGVPFTDGSFTTWFGYAPSLHGILIGRGMSGPKDEILRMRVDSKRLEIETVLLPARADRHGWKLTGDHLYRVEGHGSKVVLLKMDLNGKTERTQLPDLPSSVKVDEEWDSASSVFRSKVVLDASTSKTENGWISSVDSPLILADTRLRRSIRIGTGSGAELSPDGTRVAFVPWSSGHGVWLPILDLKSGKTRQIQVWKPRSLLDRLGIFTRPSTVMSVGWCPDGDYVAVEVMPAEMGFNYLFVVRTSTGESCRIPTKIGRCAWSWLPN